MRKEKWSNAELRSDLNRHYEEMEIHVAEDAREAFRRPVYPRIDVAEYVRKKYGIKG